jgi:hypothetical protein
VAASGVAAATGEADEALEAAESAVFALSPELPEVAGFPQPAAVSSPKTIPQTSHRVLPRFIAKLLPLEAKSSLFSNSAAG